MMINEEMVKTRSQTAVESRNDSRENALSSLSDLHIDDNNKVFPRYRISPDLPPSSPSDERRDIDHIRNEESHRKQEAADDETDAALSSHPTDAKIEYWDQPLPVTSSKFQTHPRYRPGTGTAATRTRGITGVDHAGTCNHGFSPANDDNDMLNRLTDFFIDNRTFQTLVLLLGVLVLLVVALTLSVYLSDDKPRDPTAEMGQLNFYRHFVGKLDSIINQFQSQTEKTWRVINTTVHRTLDTRAASVAPLPAVFLMFSARSAAPVLSFLSQNLSVAFGNESSILEIDTAHYNGMDLGECKESIDGGVREFVGNLAHSPGAVLVQNVDLLPPRSMLLFHSYCDQDHAPFKNLIYIFTVVLPTEPGYMKKETQFITKYLKEFWQPLLHIDEIDPLLSRIANSVVYVLSEN